jgi:hypothetical protein
MSKKKLDVTSITNELRGQSVFFPKEREKQDGQAQQITPLPLAEPNVHTKGSNDTVVSRYHETMIPSNHDTMIPLSEEEMIEAVRKAVKQIGKEPATQRLTLEEKQALDDIEYSYKRQGIKTSGNEIIRIATNYIVRDYRQNGENSILAKVLYRLNS